MEGMLGGDLLVIRIVGCFIAMQGRRNNRTDFICQLIYFLLFLLTVLFLLF